MHRNTLETVMGAIVLLAAAGFVALAYEAADVKGSGGYEIAAEFGSTGGLSVGDDVRISGIKVGRSRRNSLIPLPMLPKCRWRLNQRLKFQATVARALPLPRFLVAIILN